MILPRATTVRSKGRNLRIKAPMCRALKKLCDPDGEKYTHIHTTTTTKKSLLYTICGDDDEEHLWGQDFFSSAKTIAVRAHGVTIETHTGGGIGTCQGRRLPNGRRSLSLSILEEIPLIEVTCDI